MKVRISNWGERGDNAPHPNIYPSMNRYVNVYILLLSPYPNVYSHHFDNGTSAAALHY